MKVIDRRPLDFYMPLHNSDFSGAYYYLSAEDAVLQDELAAVMAAAGLPPDCGEPEMPYLRRLAPGIFRAFSLADDYEFYEAYGADPAVVLTVRHLERRVRRGDVGLLHAGRRGPVLHQPEDRRPEPCRAHAPRGQAPRPGGPAGARRLAARALRRGGLSPHRRDALAAHRACLSRRGQGRPTCRARPSRGGPRVRRRGDRRAALRPGVPARARRARARRPVRGDGRRRACSRTTCSAPCTTRRSPRCARGRSASPPQEASWRRPSVRSSSARSRRCSARWWPRATATAPRDRVPRSPGRCGEPRRRDGALPAGRRGRRRHHPGTRRRRRAHRHRPARRRGAGRVGVRPVRVRSGQPHPDRGRSLGARADGRGPRLGRHHDLPGRPPRLPARSSKTARVRSPVSTIRISTQPTAPP